MREVGKGWGAYQATPSGYVHHASNVGAEFVRLVLKSAVCVCACVLPCFACILGVLSPPGTEQSGDTERGCT